MNEISGELRQILDEVSGHFEAKGVTEVIIIVNYEGKNVISTKMTPQKTLLWLIDSLWTTKEQCLRQTSQAEKQTNN